jgi:hypothetical protein
MTDVHNRAEVQGLVQRLRYASAHEVIEGKSVLAYGDLRAAADLIADRLPTNITSEDRNHYERIIALQASLLEERAERAAYHERCYKELLERARSAERCIDQVARQLPDAIGRGVIERYRLGPAL